MKRGLRAFLQEIEIRRRKEIFEKRYGGKDEMSEEKQEIEIQDENGNTLEVFDIDKTLYNILKVKAEAGGIPVEEYLSSIIEDGARNLARQHGLDD